MNEKIIGKILKAPLILLNVILFSAVCYAIYKKLVTGFSAAIFLGVCLILYFIGSYLTRNKKVIPPTQ